MMRNYILIAVLIGCVAIQTMQELPPPPYALDQSSSDYSPMTIIDVSAPRISPKRSSPYKTLLRAL